MQTHSDWEVNACPICHRVDQIKKVRVVVEAGTSKSRTELTSDYYATRTLLGVHQTDLARQLSLPEVPVYKSPWGGCSITICLILLFFLIFGFVSFANLGNFDGTDPKLIGNPSFMILFGIPLVLLVAWKIMRDRKQRANLAVDRDQWRKKYQLWDRLYYCHRDGEVYLPDALDLHVPVSNMPSLFSIIDPAITTFAAQQRLNYLPLVQGKMGKNDMLLTLGYVLVFILLSLLSLALSWFAVPVYPLLLLAGAVLGKWRGLIAVFFPIAGIAILAALQNKFQVGYQQFFFLALSWLVMTWVIGLIYERCRIRHYLVPWGVMVCGSLFFWTVFFIVIPFQASVGVTIGSVIALTIMGTLLTVVCEWVIQMSIELMQKRQKTVKGVTSFP